MALDPKTGDTADDRDGRAERSDDGLLVSRKWFLASLGGVAAAIVGLQRLFSVTGGSSTSGSGRGAQRLSSSGLFPIRTVDDEPKQTLEEWVLEVDGMVETPLRVDYAAWSALPRFEEDVDFPCVEGWTVKNVHWGGVHPMDLVAEAGPTSRATHAVFHAFDGKYVDCLPLEQLREPHTILADMLDGKRLPAEHGGPVRLVVPSQLAYKSVKFVRRIELTDRLIEGYWERAGYPSDAPVSVQGRIRTSVGI